ncbi:MAG: phage major capsid protein [Oscillospiraceae bacterium]
MNTYKNIAINKNFYQTGDFSSQLESLDPSDAYNGSDLGGLDAFERQLKRFDIKVKGERSDTLSKFFQTSDSSALFPEYIARATKQGVNDNQILADIIASKTNINGLDYRTIHANTTDKDAPIIAEGTQIPVTEITLKDSLVKLKKRGRMLSASYEAVKFQKIDLFTVALKQIGSYIGKAQLKDAIDVLLKGDNGTTAAKEIQTAASGKLTYADLIKLWGEFDEFEMNTLLVSPDMMLKMLEIPELANPTTGLNFQATGKLTTPLGATLIKSSVVPNGTIIGIDKRYALEMVCAGDITVEYDKLIHTQLERASVTAITGFSRIFADSVRTLKLKS